MFVPGISMMHSSRQDPWSPTFQSTMESPIAGTRKSESPRPPAFAAPPPTQYEFITQTGDESTATTKKKLKTVRSHVMKNYLQQQQGRQAKGSGPTAIAASTDSRRRGKQRTRSSRSVSRDTDSSTSPTLSEGMRARSSSTEFGRMDFGVPFPTPFSGSGYMAHTGLGMSSPQFLTAHA